MPESHQEAPTESLARTRRTELRREAAEDLSWEAAIGLFVAGRRADRPSRSPEVEHDHGVAVEPVDLHLDLPALFSKRQRGVGRL